jgi:hypothetical protein
MLRRNHAPRSVATLLIATPLVIAVAARPRLPLRSNGSASDPADDRSDCSPAPAAQRSADDPTGDPAKNCAAHRILCGCILHWRGDRNSE